MRRSSASPDPPPPSARPPTTRPPPAPPPPPRCPPSLPPSSPSSLPSLPSLSSPFSRFSRFCFRSRTPPAEARAPGRVTVTDAAETRGAHGGRGAQPCAPLLLARAFFWRATPSRAADQAARVPREAWPHRARAVPRRSGERDG
ncbi:hypothetical protein DDQ41_17275 [Streptomyces spongiicola]|uniref:Uncharacterized protein n=1 Tax=Streptomyces spongiicola TaxID=1690221 RepID=A0ABN5KKU4_9ACTN|nr:hypothetical protein DDQ41_17275 [Streptomyces spongiicola]